MYDAVRRDFALSASFVLEYFDGSEVTKREGNELVVHKENCRGTQRQFSENICSENDLISRIFGTFFVKFLACLPLLGFSNI